MFFLHEMIVHIAVFVVVLLVFGLALEQLVGARHVVLIYLAAGFVGSLAIALASGALGLDERMVGSSAAFHGIIVVFIALRPDAVMLGSKAKTWLIVLVVANLVLMFRRTSRHAAVRGGAPGRARRRLPLRPSAAHRGRGNGGNGLAWG